MSEDRRHSFRCPVADDHSSATLQCSSGKHEVRLAEQSAGGFGIVSPTKFSLRKHELALLHTKQGTYEVRVMHATVCDDGIRIGVVRCRELRTVQREGTANSTRPTVRFPMGIVVVGVAMFLGGFSIPVCFDFGELPNRELQLDESQNRITRSVLMLHDLKSSQFMEDLRLEPSQQKRIQSSVDETIFNLNTLFQNREKMDDNERANVGLQLISQAWREIQSSLTDEQKARWQSMLSGGADATNTTAADPSKT